MTQPTTLALLFGMSASASALIAVLLAVILLTAQIAIGKVPPLIAFVVASVVAALLLGMPMQAISASIGKGMGDTLGSLVVIVGLGATFGKLIADSGAAEQIASTLLRAFKPRYMPIALALTGFVVGIPLYYNVGFVLLVPLIFSLVYRTGKPIVALAIPMLCGLSIAHGYLPPHPSPTALVGQFHADMGQTLIYGLIVGLPVLLLAGPVFATTLTSFGDTPQPGSDAAPRPKSDQPGAFVSFATALLPVFLLSLATALHSMMSANWFTMLLSDAVFVMLISYLIAIVTLGLARGTGMTALMKGAEQGLRDVAPILLVIAGAGALKQVFVDTRVNELLGAALGSLPVSPLILGWLIAVVIRVSLGSATVAGLTAAGIVAPLVQSGRVDANLMVLSIGAGSLMCSHVNDSGFWMFKEYFNLSIKDTLKTWTVMESLVGILGIIMIVALSYFI